jgi:hypothetical protein
LDLSRPFEGYKKNYFGKWIGQINFLSNYGTSIIFGSRASSFEKLGWKDEYREVPLHPPSPAPSIEFSGGPKEFEGKNQKK